MIGVILLGQSNSGKSTLGKHTANKLNIRYISSGDIARNMDEEVQNELNSGKMAPEDKIRRAILSEINSDDTPYILDGFPRFYDQYEWLNQNIDHDLIYVYVCTPQADIISRAKIRGRDDDSSINKKIEYFNEHTRPMIYEISCCEKLFTIHNGDDNSLENSMVVLNEIVEEYINVNNSQI